MPAEFLLNVLINCESKCTPLHPFCNFLAQSVMLMEIPTRCLTRGKFCFQVQANSTSIIPTGKDEWGTALQRDQLAQNATMSDVASVPQGTCAATTSHHGPKHDTSERIQGSLVVCLHIWSIRHNTLVRSVSSLSHNLREQVVPYEAFCLHSIGGPKSQFLQRSGTFPIYLVVAIQVTV